MADEEAGVLLEGLEGEGNEEGNVESGTESAIEVIPEVSDGVKEIRGPGRPRNVAGSAPLKKLRFPNPRFRQYNSDSDVREQRPNYAFKWVAALPQVFKDRCDWFIYRRHPILVEPPLDADRKPQWYKYIDKIPGADPNPITDESDLLNRFGCGRYELYLNETDVPKGDEARTILRVFVQNLGGGDYRAHPPNDPLISDVNKVDLSHPNNKGYLSYLMSIGKLPEQVNAEKERQDVATATVVDKLTDGYEKMADKVVKMAESRSSRPDPVAAPAGYDSNAIAGLLNSTGEVMKQSAMTVMEQSKGMGLDEVLKVAKELKADDTHSTSEIKELRNMLFTMQTERINKLETMLIEQATTRTANPSSTSSDGPPPSPADPFSYFKSGISALKEMKSTIDDFSGGGEGDGGTGVGKNAPWWAGLLAASMPHVATIAQTVMGLYIASQRAGQPGAQQQPMGPAPMPQGFPGMPMQPQPQPAQAPAPTMALNPAPAPAGATPSGMPPPAPASGAGGFDMGQFISLIQVPLLNYLSDPTANGDHFAEWLVGGYGLDVFKQVKQYGPLVAPILMEHTIQLPTGPVKPFADLSPGRLDKFVQEFLSVTPEDFEKDPVDGGGGGDDNGGGTNGAA